MSTLQETHDRLRESLVGDVLPVTEEVRGLLANPSLPEWVLPGAFTLRTPQIDLVAPDELVVSGVVSDTRLGALSLTVVLQTVGGTIQATPTLEVDPNAFDLWRLMGALDVPVPPLPSLAAFEAVFQDLAFDLDDPQARLVGRTPLDPVGDGVVVAARQGDGVGVVAAVEPSPGLRFGDLHPTLAPFDVVSDCVAFGSPAVVLASHDVVEFPLPGRGGEWRAVALRKGLEFRGDLKLSCAGLDFIGALIGQAALPFTMPVVPDLSAVRLHASAPGTVELLGDALVVDAFRLSVAPQPLSISASGVATLDLFGTTLPPMRLGAEITDGDYAVFLRTEEPWRRPLGLPFDIDDVGVQVSGPVPAYGFFGSMTLGARAIDVAAEFVAKVPTFVSGRVEGEVSFTALVADLVGAEVVPPMFEPAVEDVKVHLVLDPRGATIAERSFPRGVGLEGTASFLGLGVALKVNVDPLRFQGEGTLVRPITIDPVLRISGVGAPTPRVAVDTAADPVMSLSGRVELLGLVQEIVASVGTEEMSFALDHTVGPVSVGLEARLGEGALHAEGRVAFHLSGSIGPIRILPGGPSLGKIRLDTGVSLAVALSVAEREPIKLRVSGTLVVAGVSIGLPSILLDSQSFDDIPDAVFKYIEDQAVALFADLLQSAEAWLRAIAEEVIAEVENVARALKEHFDQTAEQVARGLRDTLNNTVEETARALKSIGEAPEAIARTLVAIGEPVEEVAKALKMIGEPVEVVGNVLKELGKAAKEVESILKVVGFPSKAAGDVLGSLFGGGVRLEPPQIRVRKPKLHVNHIKLW